MKTQTPTDDNDATADGVPRSRHGGAGVGAATGAAAGAAIGSFAGPVGAVAGALLGAGIGAATGAAIADDIEDQDRHDKQLDKEIGVTDGDLGAADPNMPPAIRGVYSMGAAGGGGMGGPEEAPASSGPMPHGE
jgi:hypothetical protein